MGLFGQVGDIFSRVVTGIATGGLSEVARLAGAPELALAAEKLFGAEAISFVAPLAAGFAGGPGASTLVSAGLQAVRTPGSAITVPTGIVSFSPFGASRLSSPVPQPSTRLVGDTMALFGDFGGVIDVALKNIGGFGGNIGALGQIGSSVFSSLVGPATVSFAPQPASAPIGVPGPVAQPVGLITAGSMALRIAKPILLKIATALGLRSIPSLTRAIQMIRSLGKSGLAPVAIATALGISIDELARLIVTDRNRVHRRLNPANVHAIRRAARRIESFHKLCVRVDRLRARRRGAARSPKVCA